MRPGRSCGACRPTRPADEDVGSARPRPRRSPSGVLTGSPPSAAAPCGPGPRVASPGRPPGRAGLRGRAVRARPAGRQAATTRGQRRDEQDGERRPGRRRDESHRGRSVPPGRATLTATHRDVDPPVVRRGAARRERAPSPRPSTTRSPGQGRRSAGRRPRHRSPGRARVPTRGCRGRPDRPGRRPRAARERDRERLAGADRGSARPAATGCPTRRPPSVYDAELADDRVAALDRQRGRGRPVRVWRRGGGPGGRWRGDLAGRRRRRRRLGAAAATRRRWRAPCCRTPPRRRPAGGANRPNPMVGGARRPGPASSGLRGASGHGPTVHGPRPTR